VAPGAGGAIVAAASPRAPFMNNKIVALIGAALLGVGAFLPVVQIPKRGTVTFMQIEYAGIILLALVALIVALAAIGRLRHAVWPGIASLVLTGYAYWRVQGEMAAMRARAGSLQDDPLGAAQGMIAAGSRLEYGWAVLVFGAILVIAGAAMAWRREPESGPG
ncbi:MAG TPA: hypothetical protein VGB54_15030, partial [Allosphingosinicella sp.]